jgi:hypothetical protein
MRTKAVRIQKAVRIRTLTNEANPHQKLMKIVLKMRVVRVVRMFSVIKGATPHFLRKEKQKIERNMTLLGKG